MEFTTSRAWYALKVRPRHEKIVAWTLQSKGYEEFLPLYKSLRRWSDRIKQVELPLFPGYVFVRFDSQNPAPILTTPGIVAIVGAGKVPVPVDPAEMAALQTIVRSGVPIEPWQFLQVGQRVRIDDGPLAGLEGVLLEIKNSRRLIVSLSLLERAVAAEVDSYTVSSLGRGSRPPASVLTRIPEIHTRCA